MGKGDGNKVDKNNNPNNATTKASNPPLHKPLLKSAFRTPGSTSRGNIIFNPQITTDDNVIFLLENISGHHEKFPRENSLSIRPDENGNAMSLFGQSKTAYGHSNEHFQTLAERKNARTEHLGEKDYKARKKCTNTIQYMNETWNLRYKDKQNAWFTHNKRTIIVAISAFVAAGITLCLYGGTTKRKKGKTRANKTKGKTRGKTRAKR